MKKTLKKILCTLLVVVMCLTSAPFQGFVGIEWPEFNIGEWFGSRASAVEEYIEGYYTYTVADGKATITDVDRSISGDITIPATLGGYSVTTIGDYAFQVCDRLTGVVIPDSVTTIGKSVFEWCDSLTGVKIPDSITAISYRAFFNCNSLTSVTLPNDVTTIGDYAFYNCDSLTSITIPDSVTTIGYDAFYNCDNLTNVTIGDSVTTIGDSAFYWCDSLTSVTIGDSVTTIGVSAFKFCYSLTSVTIGDSVTTIGDSAFYRCYCLTDVYYTGTEEQWKKIRIGSDNEDLTGATIHFLGEVEPDVPDVPTDPDIPTDPENPDTPNLPSLPEIEIPKYEDTEEAQQYINEHLKFVNSNNYSNITTNASFYKQIWQHEEGSRNFTRYAAWDIIGDVGKFIALDFYGILKTDNPYDVILVDVFRDFVNRQESTGAAAVENAGKAIFTSLNTVNDFISIFKTSDAWNTELEGAATAYLKKLNTDWLKGVIFTEDTFDLKDYDESLYNGLYEILSKFSKGGDLKNSLNKGFSGLKNISTIADYISAGGDMVWKIFDAYQKYLLAQALCETNAEILGAIETIAKFDMPDKASKLLRDALDPYWEVFTCDDFYASISKVLAEDGIWGSGTNAIYSLLVKETLKDIVYTALGKVCGFSFWALSATYNLTYMCLDYLSGLGKQSEMHKLLNAAALFEKPFLSLVNNKSIELKNNKNLDSAVRFDALWGVLQSLEGLCYKSMNTYISAFKQEYIADYVIETTVTNNWFYAMIKGVQLKEDISACDSAMEVMVYLENEWRNMNCHNKKYTSSNMTAVKCPTDVYVYDSDGNLALSIINNKVTFCVDEISAFVDGNEKIFVTPDTQKYTVKIKATDNGVMNVNEAKFTNMEYVRLGSFENVNITNGKVYTLDSDNNTLNRDDGIKIHDNGQIEGCSCNCHKSGFMGFIWKIINFFQKLFRTNKTCTCGVNHY